MNAPLLSIIMPVYNVAAYLPACLDSLAALDPSPDEIIAVDDGSTDACPQILAEYARHLPQMKVIRQENGGLSVARNTGLAVARGKYLAFVDSDDFLSADAYAAALGAAERDNLDMVLFNADYHFEGRQPDRPVYGDAATTDVIAGREWLRMRLEAGRFLHMVWMHLYRRDFIERHGFRFVPRLLHEDVIWTTEALLSARRVRYLDHVAVHYRIPLRTFTPEQNQRRLEAIVASSLANARALGRMANELAEENDPKLAALLRGQMVDGALSIFHKLKKMPDRKAARHLLVQLRRDGLFRLLWPHARGWPQHRRIMRHWLRATILGLSAQGVERKM
jgi:glycosyltransferase involved in cell wall biosynthesis